MALLVRGAVVALLLLIGSLAFATSPLPPGIDTVNTGAGRLFVNAKGHALYTFKQDLEQPGTSLCNFECAKLWPPVTAPENAEPIGEWSALRREDGSWQWARRGSPVYTHSADTHPGSLVGEKASGFWDVMFEPMATPPGIAIAGSLKGQILVDVQGRTLYANAAGRCDAACQADRRPVEAPWLAGPLGKDWTLAQRNDGLKQWTYRNQPLFTYAGDFKPGDVNGEDAALGWQVVVLKDAPGVPDWVTFQETDLGPVFANQDRMTLYYLVNDPEQIRRETCDAQCVAANWQPLVAPPGASPIGNWAPVASADGALQWTYLGLTVYTYRHDRIPGDINGDKFGAGVGVRGGWQAILKETLIQKLF